MRGFIFHDVCVEVSENVNVKCASVKCVWFSELLRASGRIGLLSAAVST